MAFFMSLAINQDLKQLKIGSLENKEHTIYNF